MKQFKLRALGPLALWCLGLAVIIALPCTSPAQTNQTADLVWHDARDLSLEGKGWSDTKNFYDRLPARAEGLVTSSVWGLSRNSAGMCVRFTTDATSITARWKLRSSSLAMPHMPATGVSGVDLYVKRKSGWRWVANGRPLQQSEEKLLISGLAPGQREFALYLPLYNGVEEVKVGVPAQSVISAMPARGPKQKPIVFYGTSILQGGCASRPGTAYPSILGRKLDWPTINLGFSGSARCEPELARVMAELDPAVYVLDPLANMTAELVAERMENFVQLLRRAHPQTPIVLVENARYPNEEFLANKRAKISQQNQRLREIYERLVRAGDKRLFYLRAQNFLGEDGEATVDGTHPNDVGFLRMAEAIEPTLKRALRQAR